MKSVACISFARRRDRRGHSGNQNCFIFWVQLPGSPQNLDLQKRHLKCRSGANLSRIAPHIANWFGTSINSLSGLFLQFLEAGTAYSDINSSSSFSNSCSPAQKKARKYLHAICSISHISHIWFVEEDGPIHVAHPNLSNTYLGNHACSCTDHYVHVSQAKKRGGSKHKLEEITMMGTSRH